MNQKRKAQMSEFTAIALLLISFILFSLFNMLNNAETKISTTQTLIDTTYALRAATAANSGLKTTSKNIPVYDLLGNVACYQQETADYGTLKVNIGSELRSIFDPTFGEENWMFETKLEDKYVCVSSTFVKEPCKKEQNMGYKVYEFLIPVGCQIDYARGSLYVKEH